MQKSLARVGGPPGSRNLELDPGCEYFEPIALAGWIKLGAISANEERGP